MTSYKISFTLCLMHNTYLIKLENMYNGVLNICINVSLQYMGLLHMKYTIPQRWHNVMQHYLNHKIKLMGWFVLCKLSYNVFTRLICTSLWIFSNGRPIRCSCHIVECIYVSTDKVRKRSTDVVMLTGTVRSTCSRWCTIGNTFLSHIFHSPKTLSSM